MTANTTVCRPDLPQLKRRARELQRALLRGDADAIDRLKRAHPLWRAKLRATARLADAQLVIAREAGHASWPALRRQVLSVRRVLLPAATSPTIQVHASSELRGLIGTSVQLTGWELEGVTLDGDAVVTRERHRGVQHGQQVEWLTEHAWRVERGRVRLTGRTFDSAPARLIVDRERLIHEPIVAEQSRLRSDAPRQQRRPAAAVRGLLR